ncbi:L-rhamnose-binding lectin SML-like [Cheilinus undulatus]|uniref:L-rhamnose-binding lectin SML-like n=1 Tax=Cheilinus undulatus TaxID=241271 RepID=UPI001BD51C35|nr:L-rhamnose-binding lectin SML-like [Cheilinus undulatus]
MFVFSLSSTLLLAATCSLISADSLTICDDSISVQRLSCDSGVISVQGALYGRADRVTCSEGRSPQQLANTQCSQRGTADTLRRRCNGKKVCELNSDVVRTSDPCYGISKYLQTNFTCLPAIHLVACEGSYATLRCDVGQVIELYGAHYGRLDRSICSFQRSVNQLQNIYCSRPVSRVAERCNGKNSCAIRASNAEFGDPCYGTYKYLEVSYTCLYPA